MSIADRVREARQRCVERWLLDPGLHTPPNDLTFAEIDAACDRIEERVKQCRAIYPFTKPKTPTEAILRRADQIY